MSKPSLYAGLDVGGTTMKAGIVDDEGRPLSAVSLPTEAHKGQEHGLAEMCASIRQAAAEARVEVRDLAAIGVATPGLMDIPAGVILEPPNLKPWRNVPVRQHIHDVFGIPTAFQNDANAAAYGEYWVGAGREVHSMVMFTLGTGVGGGIIWSDRVIEGEHSHGAELGHIKIEMTNPRPCGCGRHGCLEAYASATSVVQRTQESLADDPGRSSLHALANQGELTARDIFDAASAGDALAGKIVEDTAYYLAVGAMNLMHTIDPDMVVYGGGMIAAGDAFLERIRHHVRDWLSRFPPRAPKSATRSWAVMPASLAQPAAVGNC